MAKTTKKTKAAAKPNPQGSIFDHFSAHHPGHEFAEPDTTQSQRPAAREVDYSAQLAELKRQNDELTARLNAPQLPRAPAATAPQQIDPAALRFSTDGLPDPGLDPDRYNAELQRRVNAALEANVHHVRQQAAGAAGQSQQAQTLWTQFSATYPQWADQPDRVRYAAETVIADAKARGLDTELYISSYADTFVADVAKKMTAVFGDPLEADDNDEEDAGDDDTNETLDGHAGDDDDGRTAGIFGGLESGGRPEGRKAPPAGDMIKDLQDIQRKSGFF